MAATKEYALLCLENPLLGTFTLNFLQLSRTILPFHQLLYTGSQHIGDFTRTSPSTTITATSEAELLLYATL